MAAPEPVTASWLVDDFTVSLVLVLGESGAPEVRELHITPREDREPAPLTARWLRTLRLGDLADAMFSTAAQERADASVKEALEAESEADPDLRAALTAQAYVALTAATPRPSHMLAEALGLSIHGVRQRVAQARQRGMLSPASAPGQGGGQVTPKADAVLRKHRDAARGSEPAPPEQPPKRSMTKKGRD